MASKAVQDFFNEQNRPYSLATVCEGIKDEFSKTDLQKAMATLVEQGSVREKAYGKQKVYFPVQTKAQSSNDINEEIRSLDRQINDLTAKVQEREGAINLIQGKYSERKGRLTLPQACVKKDELNDELRTLKESLKAFDGVALIEPKVKKQVQTEYDRRLGLYRKRKRMCLDMLDAILEGYQKRRADLYEEIGIETDEEAGFNAAHA